MFLSAMQAASKVQSPHALISSLNEDASFHILPFFHVVPSLLKHFVYQLAIGRLAIDWIRSELNYTIRIVTLANPTDNQHAFPQWLAAS
jgi:hypothetical protein